MEFKVGDIVKCVFYGDEEFELMSDSVSSLFPLAITSDICGHITFTLSGRVSTSHTHPVLTLVSRPRPKKKVKKVIVGYVNVYDSSSTFGMVHLTEESALSVSNGKNILKAAHKIEVEVEVDEAN